MQKVKIIVGVLLVLIIAAACGGAYFYKTVQDVADSDTISDGVMIDSVAVGGMTEQEAIDAVTKFEDELKSTKVTFTYDGKDNVMTVDDLGYTYGDVEKAAKEAYQIGKEGSTWERYKAIREGKKSDANFEIEKKISQDGFQAFLDAHEEELMKVAKDATMTRENGEWIITDAEEGMEVPVADNVKAINEVLATGWDYKDFSYELEAKKAQPEITREDLEKLTSVIGTYSTDYSTSNYNRKTNVQNAASLIDGSVVYPGETFSVMDHICPLSAANGYLEAGSYSQGEVIQSYGGGVCQVATTLYNAVLEAELEVVERNNHQMTVHYVPLSFDAAVSDVGQQDFKFTNNLENAIYIEASANGATLTFTIYGEETRPSTRTIKYWSRTDAVIEPGEKVTKDKTMEKGEEEITKKGETGYRASLWKDIYENGEKVSTIQVNSSYYAPVKQEKTVGTKKKTKKPSSKKPAKKEESSDEDDVPESTEAPATEAPATEAPAEETTPEA